ncbi:MAG: hypothetical protein AB7O99_04470 [Dongiaceae bacterium]
MEDFESALIKYEGKNRLSRPYNAQYDIQSDSRISFESKLIAGETVAQGILRWGQPHCVTGIITFSSLDMLLMHSELRRSWYESARWNTKNNHAVLIEVIKQFYDLFEKNWPHGGRTNFLAFAGEIGELAKFYGYKPLLELNKKAQKLRKTLEPKAKPAPNPKKALQRGRARLTRDSR